MTPIDTLEAGGSLPRHHHAGAYAAIVLSGGYEEAGEVGRFRVGPGDVLIHAPFSTHLDRQALPGTTVLNLPLAAGSVSCSTCQTVTDVDAIVRLAERDRFAAAHELVTRLGGGAEPLDEEVDRMVRALGSGEDIRIEALAEDLGLSRSTAWRRLKAAYGVGPVRFRLEARARRAWRRLIETTEPLALVAAVEGYADQAHMSRDVRALTGQAPGLWRASRHLFKISHA